MPFEELSIERAAPLIYILEREVPEGLAALRDIERELKFPSKK